MAIGVNALAFIVVAQVLAVAGIAMVLVWCIHFLGGLAWEATDKSLIFNIHPVLMLIGLVIIGGEAIMSFKALPLKNEVKKVIHTVLHAVALVLGIIGIYAAFKYHNESSISNLYSLHAWLGIGIIVLYAIQWIYGFLIFLYPGGSREVRRETLPWHVILGIIIFSLAVGNAAIGFLEKLTFLEVSGLTKFSAEAYLANFTAVVTVLYGVFVVLSVLSRPVVIVEEETVYTAL